MSQAIGDGQDRVIRDWNRATLVEFDRVGKNESRAAPRVPLDRSSPPRPDIINAFHSDIEFTCFGPASIFVRGQIGRGCFGWIRGNSSTRHRGVVARGTSQIEIAPYQGGFGAGQLLHELASLDDLAKANIAVRILLVTIRFGRFIVWVTRDEMRVRDPIEVFSDPCLNGQDAFSRQAIALPELEASTLRAEPMELGPHDRKSGKDDQPGAAGRFEGIDAVWKVPDDTLVCEQSPSCTILPGFLDQDDIELRDIATESNSQFCEACVDFVGPVHAENGYAPEIGCRNVDSLVTTNRLVLLERLDARRGHSALGASAGGHEKK